MSTTECKCSSKVRAVIELFQLVRKGNLGSHSCGFHGGQSTACRQCSGTRESSLVTKLSSKQGWSRDLQELNRQAIHHHPQPTEQINHVASRCLQRSSRALVPTERESCSGPVVSRPLRSKISLGQKEALDLTGFSWTHSKQE